MSVNINVPHGCKEQPCSEGRNISQPVSAVRRRNDGRRLKLFEQMVESSSVCQVMIAGFVI